MAATPLERTPGSHARLCPSTPTDRGLYLDGQEGASRSIVLDHDGDGIIHQIGQRDSTNGPDLGRGVWNPRIKLSCHHTETDGRSPVRLALCTPPPTEGRLG
jgi:hypothetical protein